MNCSSLILLYKVSLDELRISSWIFLWKKSSNLFLTRDMMLSFSIKCSYVKSGYMPIILNMYNTLCVQIGAPTSVDRSLFSFIWRVVVKICVKPPLLKSYLVFPALISECWDHFHAGSGHDHNFLNSSFYGFRHITIKNSSSIKSYADIGLNCYVFVFWLVKIITNPIIYLEHGA